MQAAVSHAGLHTASQAAYIDFVLRVHALLLCQRLCKLRNKRLLLRRELGKLLFYQRKYQRGLFFLNEYARQFSKRWLQLFLRQRHLQTHLAAAKRIGFILSLYKGLRYPVCPMILFFLPIEADLYSFFMFHSIIKCCRIIGMAR